MSTKISSQIGSDRVIKQGYGNKFVGSNEINVGDISQTVKSIAYWSKNENYDGLVNTTAGIAYIPSTTAYGEWEFDVNSNSNPYVNFISDGINGGYNNDGYQIYFYSGTNVIFLRKTINGSSSVILNTTSTGYYTDNTDYRIKIERTHAGVFTLYIRGGSFGWDDWTTVGTATDNTYTTSNYFVADLDPGDKISNLKINGVPTPLSTATQSSGTWTIISGSTYPLNLSSTQYIEIDSNNILSASNVISPTYYINSIITRSLGSSITRDKWNHITITTDTPITVDELKIGSSSNGEYIGEITDLRLYSDVLTPTEINDLYQGKPLIDNLVYYAPFCESTGSVIHDASGNRNSGSMSDISIDYWTIQGICPSVCNWYGFNDSGSYISGSYDWPSNLNNNVLIPAETDNLIDKDCYGNDLQYTGRVKLDTLLSSGSSGSNNEINEGSRVEFNSNLIENLVGYWSLAEADTLNGSVKDLSGNGNDATIVVTPATFTNDQNGVPNQAMSFDGVGDYVTLNTPITFTSNNSLSWWSKINDKDFSGIVGGNLGNYAYIRFGISTGTELTDIFSETNTNGDTIRFNFGSLGYDTWHHFVITQDSSNDWTLYIDGIAIGTDTTTNSDLTIAIIGKGRINSDYFDGSISDVAIYSSALTQDEVSQLYKAGKRKLPFENNFQNKSAIVNNTNNLPQYWKPQLTSQSGYTDDSNWLMSSSIIETSLNIDNIFTYGTEDLWRKLFIEENYSDGNVVSYENLVTYNTNRTNSQINQILEYFNNTETSASYAEWLNRKNSNLIYYYSPTFSSLKSGSTDNILCLMDVSLEKSSSATDKYNWFDLYPSGNIEYSNTNGITLNATNSLESNTIPVDTIDFYNNNWTFYCYLNPNKYTSSETGIVEFSGSNTQTGLYLSLGEFTTSSYDEFKLTIVSGSNNTCSVNWLAVTCSNNNTNEIVATYDTSSTVINLYNYFDSTWYSSSVSYSAVDVPFDTEEINGWDSQIYSGSIKMIRLYKDEIKNKDIERSWN